MSDLVERLHQLASLLDDDAHHYENIAYHHQAEDVRELITINEELEALLTRVLIGGNAKLPTRLLTDIREALEVSDE